MDVEHESPIADGRPESSSEEEADKTGARALLAKRIAEERLKRAADRIAKKRWPSVEAVATLAEDELLWDVPHARLRSFLKEKGVPAQTLLSANWFWLRVEAMRHKIDMEPLRVEMAAASEQAAADLDARTTAANNKHQIIKERVEAQMERKVHEVINRLRMELHAGSTAMPKSFRDAELSGDNKIDQGELEAWLFKASSDAKAERNRTIERNCILRLKTCPPA